MITIRQLFMKWMLLILSAISLSCSTARERKNQEQGITDFTTPYADSISELTPEQQAAFDALNILQTNTDQMNRLYSTFANINQSCYPPDTNFTISRTELLIAMNQFVTKHCTNLSIEKREGLAATAVLAQENYTVFFCSSNSDNLNLENRLPLTGTWILPGVLGRRDVILIW